MSRPRAPRASSASIWSPTAPTSPTGSRSARPASRHLQAMDFMTQRPHARRRHRHPGRARHRVRGGGPVTAASLVLALAAQAPAITPQPEAVADVERFRHDIAVAATTGWGRCSADRVADGCRAARCRRDQIVVLEPRLHRNDVGPLRSFECESPGCPTRSTCALHCQSRYLRSTLHGGIRIDLSASRRFVGSRAGRCEMMAEVRPPCRHAGDPRALGRFRLDGGE